MTTQRIRTLLAAGSLLLGVAGARGAPVARPGAGDGNLTLGETNGVLSGAFTYQLVVGQFYEWNTDPTAVPGILHEVARRTGVKADVDFKAVGLSDPQILRNPFLIMTGNRVFRLGKEEIANLRDYLERGGFLYADDCGGSDTSFRRMIKELYPETELTPLPAGHAALQTPYALGAVPKIVDLYGGPATAYALVRNGRLVILYTHDTDLPCAWEQYPNGSYVHVIESQKREESLRFGVNVIVQALKQRLSTRDGVAAGPAEGGTTAALASPLPAGALHYYPMRRQLPTTHITALAAGPEQVWVGGFSFLPGDDEGLAAFDKRTGQWRVWMDAEGILSEEINCLALDGRQVLVGSDTWKWTKGMASFDPATARWKTVTTEQGLPHNRIVAILPDQDQLWIACRQGLAVRTRTASAAVARRTVAPAVRLHTTPPASRITDERLEVERPAADHGNESQPAELASGERQAPETTAQTITVIQDAAFPKDGPFMIGLMRSENFLWANHFAGIACLDKRSGVWTALNKSTPLLPRHAVDMACAGGAAWFLSPVNDHMKLVRFDLEGESFAEWKVPNELNLEHAVSLATNGKELLIGMKKNQGIFSLALPDGTLAGHWTPGQVPPDQSLSVGRLMYDEETVWAALWPNGGLWRKAANERQWREIPYRTGTPASHILAMLRLNGSLVVGTLGVGAWRYDLTRRTWTSLNLNLIRGGQPYHYLGDYSAIRWDSIYAMTADGSRVWMGTNHGLIMHDPVRTPSGFEVIGPIDAMVKGVTTAHGRVWVGMDSGVIGAYDPAARVWTEGYTNRAPIRALCAWSNALWAATGQGLLVRAGAQSAWTVARALPTGEDLAGVWPLGDGLWVAGRGGVRIVREAGQPAQELAGSRGWGAVHSVYPWRGKVLVGTDRGLLVCTPTGALLACYDRSSGLETPAISAVLADDTRLWLGTLGSGLASLDAIP